MDELVIHRQTNEGISSVDQAIDNFIINNLDSLAAEGEMEDWSDFTAYLLADISKRYTDAEVVERLGAYIVDRMSARRCDIPYYTQSLARNYINERKKLPEGPDWLSYVKENSKSQHIGCFL